MVPGGPLGMVDCGTGATLTGVPAGARPAGGGPRRFWTLVTGAAKAHVVGGRGWGRGRRGSAHHAHTHPPAPWKACGAPTWSRRSLPARSRGGGCGGGGAGSCHSPRRLTRAQPRSPSTLPSPHSRRHPTTEHSGRSPRIRLAVRQLVAPPNALLAGGIGRRTRSVASPLRVEGAVAPRGCVVGAPVAPVLPACSVKCSGGARGGGWERHDMPPTPSSHPRGALTCGLNGGPHVRVLEHHARLGAPGAAQERRHRILRLPHGRHGAVHEQVRGRAVPSARAGQRCERLNACLPTPSSARLTCAPSPCRRL
jgi:hypothetical protein